MIDNEFAEEQVFGIGACLLVCFDSSDPLRARTVRIVNIYEDEDGEDMITYELETKSIRTMGLYDFLEYDFLVL